MMIVMSSNDNENDTIVGCGIQDIHNIFGHNVNVERIGQCERSELWPIPLELVVRIVMQTGLMI